MKTGLESILKFRVFEERYPFPQSEKYAEIIEFIQNNLVDYSFIWTVLVVWNDLRLLGKLITNEPAYAEISRSWLDEWGLARHVDSTLQGMGFDAGQAHSGKPEVRSFLGVNRHRDVLWFNKEAFESMMWWMMTIGLLDQVSNPKASLTEAVETLFDAYGLIQEILDAEGGSEYQVERLLEGLK
jgi:hypothetical protein